MVFKLSRHLLDISLTLGYLSSFQTFSYYNLNRSLTARWIDWESSWTFDSWWIDWDSLCFIPRHLLDSCICRYCFSRHLPRQMARHLSTRLSVENCWSSIYWVVTIRFSFSWSLSINLLLFSSQTLSSPSKPSTHVIFGLSLLQITWYVFFFSHSSCISCI